MLEQNGGGAMRYVEALFRERRLVSLISGTIVAVAVLYAVFARPQYGSTMKILIQNTRATPVISGDRNGPLMTGGSSAEAMESQINSEVVLLQSADLMEGLVRYRSGLANIKAPAEGSLEMAHKLQDVQHRMEITPIRKTNFVEVSFKDSDPALAQKSLNWLSTAFLDKHAELRRPAGTYRFFDTQTKQLDEQLQTAQAALITFQQQNNLVSLNQEKLLALDNYNRINQEIGDAKTNLQESDRRLSTLQRQIGEVNGRITTQVRDIPNQYSAEHLNSLVIDLQNKRTQLIKRFQPTDPLIQEVDEQIATTQAALRKATEQNTVETVSDNNPVRQSLEQARETTATNASGTNARLTALGTQAGTYAARLDDLRKVSVQNDMLERRVQELKQNRDLYAQKRDEANIDDQLDRSKIVDVSIAQEPTISLQPVQPHRLTSLIFGVLVACFASFAFVLIKDAMRETAFTPAELEAMVGCPVLATIPERRRDLALPADRQGLTAKAEFLRLSRSDSATL